MPGRRFVHDSGFVHALNAEGYRSDNFADRGDYAVLTIGCSWAFGYCVEYEHTWSMQFCRELARLRGGAVVNWNLALPGVSNDYIARMVVTCVPVMAPDYVLIAFTHPARAEYWLDFDACLHYRPAIDEVLDRHAHHIHQHLTALRSESHDMWRLFSSFALIDAVLKVHRVPWMYTFACADGREPSIATWLGGPYLGVPFERCDLAADGKHPGKESHARMARRAVETWTRKDIGHSARNKV